MIEIAKILISILKELLKNIIEIISDALNTKKT